MQQQPSVITPEIAEMERSKRAGSGPSRLCSGLRRHAWDITWNPPGPMDAVGHVTFGI